MISLASVEDALIHMGIKKKWALSQEGPSLAVCAKELEGERTKLWLFARFKLSVDDANQALKEAGFSNLVRVSSVIGMEEFRSWEPERQIIGSSKP